MAENDIGKRIDNLLEARKMTHGDLMRATGLSGSLISRYISGERTPYGENLKKIADALVTSVEYLTGEEGFTADATKTLTHASLSKLLYRLEEDKQELILKVAEVFSDAKELEDKVSDSIGVRIDSVMGAKGMEVKDIAKKIDTTPQVVAVYLNGSRIPGRRVIEKICTALDCDTDLITGEFESMEDMSPTQYKIEQIVKTLPIRSQQVLLDVALRFVRATHPEKLD